MPNTTSCPADHQHGENTKCYLHHGCRCAVCREGQARRARQRRREQAYGTYTRRQVDAVPAREHLAWLRSQGMGVRYISAACGVPTVTLSGIIWGRHDSTGHLSPAKRIREATETAILAVQPTIDLLADHALVDARGTRRRLQALARCGWSLTALAREAGVPQLRFQRSIRADRVTADTARLVVRVYDRLWNQPPASTTVTERAMALRTRRHAEKNRWVGPLAWDDIDTDERPSSGRSRRRSGDTDDQEPIEPDWVAVELAIAGHPVHLTPIDRRQCVRLLHEERWSDGLIADQIRCDEKTVGRIRDELHLPAWPLNEQITRSIA